MWLMLLYRTICVGWVLESLAQGHLSKKNTERLSFWRHNNLLNQQATQPVEDKKVDYDGNQLIAVLPSLNFRIAIHAEFTPVSLLKLRLLSYFVLFFFICWNIF